jgi:hypothetical protein
MKIELSHQDMHLMAGHYAADILWAVHEQHARLLNGDAAGWAYIRERIQAIRATVRSIEDPWDRRSFVISIGYLFKELRKEKGTFIRGRDYVAKVRAYEAQQQQERRAA